MSAATVSMAPESPTPGSINVGSARITSINTLRGLLMFAMIFANDLVSGSDRIVPPWMKHFHGKNGMTFVDMVFPAFLFVVGMSSLWASL
jgi:heparan-alpha-glucosaminide N-acetyltransferase